MSVDVSVWRADHGIYRAHVAPSFGFGWVWWTDAWYGGATARCWTVTKRAAIRRATHQAARREHERQLWLASR